MMRSKKELIDIANALDTKEEYVPLYEFASKFLQGNKQKGDTREFFNVVNILSDHSKNPHNFAVLGFAGNNSFNSLVIKDWCNNISNGDLEKLEYAELHFVMGYCARLAFIHKKNPLKKRQAESD